MVALTNVDLLHVYMMEHNLQQYGDSLTLTSDCNIPDVRAESGCGVFGAVAEVRLITTALKVTNGTSAKLIPSVESKVK